MDIKYNIVKQNLNNDFYWYRNQTKETIYIGKRILDKNGLYVGNVVAEIIDSHVE